MVPPIEQRRSERLPKEIPIRVIGFALEKNEFSEDTTTVAISREGARIKLKQKVAPHSTVRIINLENYNEADFRVVGPSSLEGREASEWGVEYVELARNIWGIEIPAVKIPVDDPGALLECRVCHQQDRHVLSPMEAEAMNSAGILALNCDKCNKLTYWNYADPRMLPVVFPPPDLIAPAVPDKPVEKKGIEKRKAKRLGMKLKILVRNSKGVEEIGKTEDISKGGVAVALAMDLVVGEQVTVICPYSGQGNEPGQKAEVRRRAAFTFNERRHYGFLYLH
ncbi:MAG TPA: PilZ domain-containing protein [Terriglobia bacterium]|nr:PilZ domain-containing protein [Terriglobia bacterium]